MKVLFMHNGLLMETIEARWAGLLRSNILHGIIMMLPQPITVVVQAWCAHNTANALVDTAQPQCSTHTAHTYAIISPKWAIQRVPCYRTSGFRLEALTFLMSILHCYIVIRHPSFKVLESQSQSICVLCVTSMCVPGQWEKWATLGLGTQGLINFSCLRVIQVKQLHL